MAKKTMVVKFQAVKKTDQYVAFVGGEEAYSKLDLEFEGLTLADSAKLRTVVADALAEAVKSVNASLDGSPLAEFPEALKNFKAGNKEFIADATSKFGSRCYQQAAVRKARKIPMPTKDEVVASSGLDL